MDKQPQSRAPVIVAIVLLIMPVMYLGSYLSIVVPYTGPYINDFPIPPDYRWGGDWAARIFWPLEQIDRRVRPGEWESEF